MSDEEVPPPPNKGGEADKPATKNDATPKQNDKRSDANKTSEADAAPNKIPAAVKKTSLVAGRDIIQISADTEHWTDPSSAITLPAPLDSEDLDIRRAAEQLRKQRVIVVDSLDSNAQLRATASLAAELKVRDREIAYGRIRDGVTLHGDAAQPRWNTHDLGHADLRDGAKLILLELEGAAGMAYFDTCFSSAGALRSLTATLETAHRHLLLLPRSRVGGSAQRSALIPRLVVPSLGLLLRGRYPESFEHLEAQLRDKLARGDWSNEEQLYQWLCALPPGLSSDALRAMLDDCGEPSPLPAVKEALERCDASAEVFLTAIFVATYLPSLQVHLLFEVVHALLSTKDRALSHEWHRTSRNVLKLADLHISRDDLGTLAFRTPQASVHLKRLLDSTPMFLELHLERLQRTELLFHQHDAVRRAVIELLAARTARQRDALDTSWLLELLRCQVAPPKQPSGSAPTLRGGVPHAARCTAELLHRLCFDPREAATPEAPQPVDAVTSDLLDSLFHGGMKYAAMAIEISFLLRHCPGFNALRWLRYAFRFPYPKLHERCQTLIHQLIRNPDEGAMALRALFAWPKPKEEGREAEEDADDGGPKEKKEPASMVASVELLHAVAASFVAAREPSGELTPPIASAAPVLSLLRERSQEALRPLLENVSERLDIEWVNKEDLAWLFLPRELLSELPEDARTRRITDLHDEWHSLLLRAPPTTWRPCRRRASLRLVMTLTAWRFAHPHASEPLRAAAAIAHDFLGADAAFAQEWAEHLQAILCHCDANALADARMTFVQRQRWLAISRARRRQLDELRDWLGGSACEPPHLAPRTSAEPHEPLLSRKEAI